MFKGELSANEDLVIEGQVEGMISHQDKNLTVGEQGRVTADIRAQMVEIQGEVNGDIYGDELVKLSGSAVVNGNIRCARFVVEEGASFSGRVEMKPAAEPKARLQIADSADPVTTAEHSAA